MKTLRILTLPFVLLAQSFYYHFKPCYTIIDRAKRYAILSHNATFQTYDMCYLYFKHLNLSYNVGKKFIYLVPTHHHSTYLAAIWVHDVIEDTRRTYNDVKNALNESIANISYAVTNEKGKNRAERANYKYYMGIINTDGAIYVKLCDRIANLEYSLSTGNSMGKKYVKEHPHFVKTIYSEDYKPMFNYMDELIKKLG